VSKKKENTTVANGKIISKAKESGVDFWQNKIRIISADKFLSALI